MMKLKLIAAARILAPVVGGVAGGLLATASPEAYAAFCGVGM